MALFNIKERRDRDGYYINEEENIEAVELFNKTTAESEMGIK